jgi:tetratricopeptide (TPR) repeat protein
MGKGRKSSPRKEAPPRRQPAAGGGDWGYWLSLAGLAGLTALVYSNTLALAHNANNLDYLYEAAFIAQARGNYMEALGYLELIHPREPNIKISRFLGGWCHQAMGRPDRAEGEYRLAIRHRPDYAQSYANLAYALMTLGRTKEACGYFEKFLKLEPQNQGVRAALEACRKSESN